MTSNDLEFWSPGNKYGLRIPKARMPTIIKHCNKANGYETGGILTGCYTIQHGCANVTAISGAPTDSQKAKTWYYRGVVGLQPWLNYLWYHKQEYYLGEWHYHPFSEPNLSINDIQQMKQISEEKRYNCPEPILIIIGGDPNSKWFVRAFVFPQKNDSEELLQ